MHSYGPLTIHVVIIFYVTGTNYIVVTSKASFCNILMGRVEAVVFSGPERAVNACVSSSELVSDSITPKGHSKTSIMM